MHPMNSKVAIMSKSFQKLLLAALLAGGFSAPALAEAPLSQGEAFFRSGQTALTQEQWFLAMLLWDEIPINAEAYPQVREQFRQLQRKLRARGLSLDEALAAKTLEIANSEARQGHLISALYFLSRIPPSTSSNEAAQRLAQRLRHQLAANQEDYQAALERYTQSYRSALRAWNPDDINVSWRQLHAIPAESPYYYQAQALEGYFRQTLTVEPPEFNPDYRPHQPEPRHQPEFRMPQRHFALGVQGRLGFAGDTSAGGGLGLSWFPSRQAALHLEANLFPLSNGLSAYIPLTARYLMPLDPNWDIYLGAGGFWSGGQNVSVFGLVGEVGTTKQFAPGWSFDFGGDYALPLSTPGAQTLGLHLGLLTTF